MKRNIPAPTRGAVEPTRESHAKSNGRYSSPSDTTRTTYSTCYSGLCIPCFAAVAFARLWNEMSERERRESFRDEDGVDEPRLLCTCGQRLTITQEPLQ